MAVLLTLFNLHFRTAPKIMINTVTALSVTQKWRGLVIIPYILLLLLLFNLHLFLQSHEMGHEVRD